MVAMVPKNPTVSAMSLELFGLDAEAKDRKEAIDVITMVGVVKIALLSREDAL